jgi:hypothetical protein
MSTRLIASFVSVAVLGSTLVVAACGSTNNTAELGSSPVVSGRSVAAVPSTEGIERYGGGTVYDRVADAQTKTKKVVAPVPATWDALVAAMSARVTKPTLLDRSIGRVGDTSLVLLRRWNGQQLSKYFSCGSTMDGPRADADRIHAVFLAQVTRLAAETVAIVVHLSGYSTSTGGTGGGQCETTGRMEQELLDEVSLRLGIR